MTHFDHLAKRSRRRKTRSGAELRARLETWLLDRGARKLPNFIGAGADDHALPLADGGELVVHAPHDDNGHGFSINTRFVGSRGPADANPHSGKWNFSCYDDEDLLFRNFATHAERLWAPPCVRELRCFCAGHARGNLPSAPCDTKET